MPIQLKIRWQGDVPGLAEKRLSLGAFAEPLSLLVAALRRIATGMVTDATDNKNRGRFANIARQLDIEVFDLVKDSTGFDSVITLNSKDASDLFHDDTNFQERVGARLLEAIDSERKGVPSNTQVRKFLQKLPAGLTQHSYDLHDNGRSLKAVSFGSLEIAVLPPEMPYVLRHVGRVVGVGFEPGRPEVRIKTDDGVVVLAATAKQVENALSLRNGDVTAVAVTHGGSSRLLVLQDAGMPINTSSRKIAVFDRWGEVLRRLAQ